MKFFFFDLETSGFSARNDRIMQFAGQRTDMNLKPVGKPENILVKMTSDVLPGPAAVLVHGITPQQTLSEGINEAELTKYLMDKVFIKDTIAIGYNNIRFDNEFIRFLLWRNFHDAYEWSWKDGTSTWDLLDVVRMTRALRPEGIEWPFAPDGKPTNSLGYLTTVNKLDHTDAHDALSDVNASIALARLLKQKQPKLFEYLLNIRNKKDVRALIAGGEPVVYTSGRYPGEFNKTTVAVMVAEKADKSGALMYDLRIDPDEFNKLAAPELASLWAARGADVPYFPIKALGYNKCPAVAPWEVLEKDGGYSKLKIHKELVQLHLRKLRSGKDFGDKLLEAVELMWPKRQPEIVVDEQKVDSQLYGGFIKDDDKIRMSAVRAAKPGEISTLQADFRDDRLKALLPLYKARNFSAELSEHERQWWQKFRELKLKGGGDSSLASNFLAQLDELGSTPGLAEQQRSLLEDLRAYGQSITRGI